MPHRADRTSSRRAHGNPLRCLVLGLMLGTGCATPPLSDCQRQAIHDTPLLDRPDRPGHIYGNTVRWLHYGHRAHNGQY